MPKYAPMAPSTAAQIQPTMVAAFWAIFTHMAAELLGVPSRFRSAFFATMVGWICAAVACLAVHGARMPTAVAGAIGAYVGIRIFYKVPPLRSFALFAAALLVTMLIFGGIVTYLSMERSRLG